MRAAYDHAAYPPAWSGLVALLARRESKLASSGACSDPASPCTRVHLISTRTLIVDFILAGPVAAFRFASCVGHLIRVLLLSRLVLLTSNANPIRVSFNPRLLFDIGL